MSTLECRVLFERTQRTLLGQAIGFKRKYFIDVISERFLMTRYFVSFVQESGSPLLYNILFV